MTKTSKIKLIVSSVLALGATGAVGGTYAALTLTGGDSEKELNDGITIDTIEIFNRVVTLGVNVTAGTGTLNVDGAETEEEKTGGIVTANELNDRKFSLDLSVTGDPKAWSYITVSFAWGGGTVGDYLNVPAQVQIQNGDSNWSSKNSGVETIKSMTKEFEITWTDDYPGGILAYLNRTYAGNASGAWSAMEDFETAVNGAKLTATVAVTTNSGAGA